MSEQDQKQPAVEAVSVSIKLPFKKNDIQLNFTKESRIQNVIELLSFTASTKYLTNYSLCLNGKQLSDTDVLGDLASGNALKLSVVLKPYTTREAIKHLLTIRDIIGFASEVDDGLAEYAVSTGCKISEMPLTPIKEHKKEEEPVEGKDDQEKTEKYLEVSEEEKAAFNETVSRTLESHSSVYKVLQTKTNIITPSVRSLTLSSYNPVPAFYRTKGHLLYLQVVTLEGETFHVTATSSGFYVNKSTATRFDPSPKDNSATKFSLYDVIASHSKKFTQHVESLEKIISSLESINYVKPTTTFLHKPWLVPTVPNNAGDYARLQLSSLDFNPERNYNDEFQAIRDLPANDIQSRIDNERLLAKVVHEFTTTAVKGAMSIFYDDLVPMNPDSPRREQIYLKENIFYSFVSDVNGVYSERGGDEAAYATSNQDLHTIKLLHRVNLKDIRYLLTTIVDFAGHRILAQTPVPGLLGSMGTKSSKDETTGEEVVEDLVNDVTVVYGLDEATGNVLSNEEFGAHLENFSKVFHLSQHHVGDAEIKFSSQSKGIVGFDKRNYVLDLANTHPLDVNFAHKFFDEISDEAKRYPHRQTLIRHELVEKWWVSKVEDAKLDAEKAFDENKFAFNPDAYQIEGVEDPLVKEISNYLVEEVLPGVVKDYANGNATAPYDGEHLADTLHKNGINYRYLGQIITLAQKELDQQLATWRSKLEEVEVGNKDHEEWERGYLLKIEKMIKERQEQINKLVQQGKEVPKELTENLKLDDADIRKPTDGEPAIVNRDQLNCLIKVAELEIVTRSLKHVLKKYSKELPVSVVPSLITYVFNLLFGSQYNANPEVEISDDFYQADQFSFAKLTLESLKAEIAEQAFSRFRYELPSEWVEDICKSPYALIKSISTKFGVQLVNKDYFFTKEQFEVYKQTQEKKIRNKISVPSNTFSVNDLTVIPLVKSAEYHSIVADDFWNQGATIINEKRAEGMTLLAQSLAIKEDVNGIVHSSVAESYLAMSTIYHKLGLFPEAVAFCRKATGIYERVSGVDSFETIRSLTNLALLEINNDSPYNSAAILERVLETLNALTLVNHPGVINAYTMIQQMALGVKNTKLSIQILKKISEVILATEGEQTIAYAYNQSRIGNLYASANDLHNSLKVITEARDIFTRELGLNDKMTAQCKQWINGIEAMIQSQQQQKRLAQNQNAASNNAAATVSKKNKKQEEPNPELATKSIDELMSFIEGDSSSKKSKKNKKKGGKK